jgi:hypothetical protein
VSASAAASAVTAVTAQTASFANAFTVAGNLTAQTLVVQTITSSVDFVTGSTRFGSIIDNTHVFTGSMSVSGSATFAGNIGVGTTNTNISLRVGDATGLRQVYVSGGGYDLLMGALGTSIFGFESQSISTISNTSSTPLGIFTSQTQPVILGTQNSERLRITSAGNVGIRTTTPQASLHIAGLADQNALTIDTSNAYEIFITGSDSANIYHASPNQAIFLNTNGGPLYLGTSAASTLLTVTGSNVGIGATNPYTKLDVRGGAIGQTTTDFAPGSAGTVIYMRTGATTGNTTYGVIQVGNTGDNAGGNLVLNQFGGNVGIGTTTPTAILQVRGPNAVGTFFDAQNVGAGGAVFSRINASSSPYNQYVFNNGNVGIGRTPLSQLAIYGGPVQIMQDYPGHQTIIRSTGVSGGYNGQLTITIPEMAGAGVSQGFGGYSCEVYVSGFQGMYCHAWFSGYINNGIVTGEVTILRSNGGWSLSQTVTGTYSQGFIFYVDYPAGLTHPTARIIFNKGGDPNIAEYNANAITATWS